MVAGLGHPTHRNRQALGLGFRPRDLRGQSKVRAPDRPDVQESFHGKKGSGGRSAGRRFLPFSAHGQGRRNLEPGPGHGGQRSGQKGEIRGWQPDLREGFPGQYLGRNQRRKRQGGTRNDTLIRRHDSEAASEQLACRRSGQPRVPRSPIQFMKSRATAAPGR